MILWQKFRETVPVKKELHFDELLGIQLLQVKQFRF